MHEVVRSRLAAIVELCRKHHVHRLELFGSAIGSEFNAERSDVDFLVTFGEIEEGRYGRNYFALAAALESLLGRSVDLIVAGNIRNPYILREVEATKETVYAA